MLPKPVVVLVWVNHWLRVFALPFLAFWATTGLILSGESMDAKSLLLNGMAVTFVTEADDLLAALLLDVDLI